MRHLIAGFLCLAAFPALAQQVTGDDQRRLAAIETITQQRNAALDSVAVCIGDAKTLTTALAKSEADLAAAKKKLAELEAKVKAKTPEPAEIPPALPGEGRPQK